MALPLPDRPQRDPKAPSRSVDAFYDEAHKYGTASSRLWYWFILLSMGIANSGDATEIGAMNYILSHAEFRSQMLHNDLVGRGATVSSAVFGGMLVGGIATGLLGDGCWGRRPTLLVGLALNAVAGVCAAWSPNVSVLILCRFVGGWGIGAILSSLVTLATETTPPARRGLYITIIGSFWTLGSIYTATFAIVLFQHFDLSWRMYALVAAAPCAVGFVLTLLVVPESARYLALTGRHEQAVAVANQVANGMGYRGPPLQVEEVLYHYPPPIAAPVDAAAVQQARAAAASSSAAVLDHLERQDSSATKMAATAAAFLTHGIRRMQRGCRQTCQQTVGSSTLRQAWWGFTALFRRCMWKRTVPLLVTWCAISFGSGLTAWITTIFETLHVADVYVISLYFALAHIPGNVVAATLLDRLGRRSLLTVGMVCTSLSLFFFAQSARQATTTTLPHYHYHAVRDNDTTNDELARQQWNVVAAACSFHSALVVSWASLGVLTSEMYPTAIRSTGMGMCAAMGRVAAMGAQYVSGALMDRPSLLLTVASLSVLMGAFAPLAFQLPDMSGKNLVDSTNTTTNPQEWSHHNAAAAGGKNRHYQSGGLKSASSHSLSSITLDGDGDAGGGSSTGVGISMPPEEGGQRPKLRRPTADLRSSKVIAYNNEQQQQQQQQQQQLGASGGKDSDSAAETIFV